MKLHSRVLALVLCLVMVLGMLPTAALAAEEVADVLESINFMDSASADKFTVVNQSSTQINEGEGLYLVSTTTAMEPCNGQVTPGQPADLVEIPVEGDWTATIKFQFNQGGSRGWYEFFGFYAKAGEGYDNMAGIRGGDGAIQNFLSVDGSITADTDGVKTTSGLLSASTHWFRIAKEGTTYTCYWSTDGQEFTETFSYEETGIEADTLILDAYSGMATGYNYTVEYLYFGDDTDAMNEYALNALVDMVIGKIPEIIPIKVNDTFTLPKGAKGCTVTYTAEPDCIEGNKIVAMEEETEVALTVTISGSGVDVSKTLNVTVPAAGTSDIPVTKYQVTFVPNAAGLENVVVEVEEDDYVTVPEELSRTGYTATWRNGSANFNFDTPITQNLTLTASWTKDWYAMYSLGDEYADFFPMGCFGGQIGNAQTDTQYRTLSGNNGKLTYNIGGGRDSNGSGTTSRQAYDAAVARINADTSLSEEEKAAQIEEANRNVELVAGEPALFNTLRAIRNWNEANPDKPQKYYRQHVLAWHGSEQPKYFFCNGFNYNSSNPDWASPETMLARLDCYIQKMMERYSQFNDVILSWDVVNEALDCYTGQVRNYETYQISEWGLIFRREDLDDDPDARLYAESAWIRQAFESARKWTEYYDCDWTLYYNDYHDSNKLYEPKMSQTVKMLKPIYEAGNIDGYGMQARLAYAAPSIDLLREQIELGLTVADEFSFSEADIRSDFEPNPNYDPEQPTRRTVSGDPVWPENSGYYQNISRDNGNTFDVHNSPVYRNPDWGVGSLSNLATDPEIMTKQADFAADLMDLVLSFEGKCGAIAWDGYNDGSTFNGTTGCHMWDRNSNEKYSFYAVIGAPNRYKMNEAIAAGPDLSDESLYTAETWAPYAAALKAAKDLVDVRIYTDAGVKAVKSATADLIAATEALVEDEGGVPVTKYNVTFDFNYPGAPDPVVVQVAEGQTVEAIKAPEREGYVFTTWGTEMSFWGWTFVMPYDFATPVTADITLKASWDKDWSMMPSLAEEYEDFFVQGCFGGSIGQGQTDHHYATLSGNNGKLTYNIGGGRDADGSGTTSRTAYEAAVAEINADETLTAEEKAAKIEEANRNVELVAGEPALFNTLRAIREWNEANPDKPKKYYRQHVLAWHGSEQPKYFFCNGFNYNSADPDWASPETMLARLDNYIMKMMERYSQFNDVILSWDVVNEAIDCYTGQIRNYETYQVSEWGMIFRRPDLDDKPEERLYEESVWVRQAFESARKWTDYYECDWTLYYNDFQDSNKLYEPKMSNTIKMLEPIYEAGNIDGYGMQARLAFAYPTIDMLREQITKGLTVADEISFSEADIRSDFLPNPNYDPEQPTRRVTADDPAWPENSGLFASISSDNGNTFDVHNSPVYRNPDWGVGSLSDLATDPEIMKMQADFAADLMDLLLVDFEGKVAAVAWDGNNDASTFNRTTGCQMWDRNNNEKYSYFAIIGAPNRFKMSKAIEAGPALTEEATYTSKSWKAYTDAREAAEALVDVRIYDLDGVNAVKKATANLTAAIEALEEKTEIVLPEVDMTDIDFTEAAAADRLVVVNKESAAITEGTGLTLVSTMEAFEDAGAQLTGDAATTPKDVVMIPVEGDWTATMNFDFAQNSSLGYYEFFGFYAAEGSDYDNMAGIRGGDGMQQLFLRQDGALSSNTGSGTEDTGLKSANEFWYRIVKDGDTYACSYSTDGENYTELWTLEDTGIEADRIVIDAYSGMQVGYTYTLKSLSFGEPHKHVYTEVVTAPTCTEKGYTTYTCECGKTYVDNYVDMIPHDYKDGVCTVCGAKEEDKPVHDCPAKDFIDIPAEDNWAHKGIDYAVANKLMNGVGGNKFNPGGTLTRAELVTILYRVEGSPEAAYKGTFKDVKEGQWYTAAIEWAAANEIVKGVGDGTNFDPSGIITREQIATILYRYSGSPEVKGELEFPDVADISTFAADAMVWANQEGIINGVTVNGVNKLAPKDSATREQIASIMMRYLEAE